MSCRCDLTWASRVEVEVKTMLLRRWAWGGFGVLMFLEEDGGDRRGSPRDGRRGSNHEILRTKLPHISPQISRGPAHMAAPPNKCINWPLSLNHEHLLLLNFIKKPPNFNTFYLKCPSISRPNGTFNSDYNFLTAFPFITAQTDHDRNPIDSN